MPDKREELLDRIGEFLIRRHEAGSPYQRVLKAVRFLTASAVVLYGVALVGVTVGLNGYPERNAFLAFSLFLPIGVWLLPLFVLFPLCVLFRRRLTAVPALFVLLFLWLGMDYRFGHAPDHLPEGAIKVMTYNRGEQGRHGMKGFVDAEQPDLIALQFASATTSTLARYHPTYPYIEGLRPFVLMSKFPIEDQRAVSLPFIGGHRHMVAVRSVVRIRGQRVVVYNVHLPTPRDALYSMRRFGFLLGLIGLPGTPLGQKREQIEAYWEARVDLAGHLAREIEAEELPTLVLGDFNTPGRGEIYRLFGTRLTDSHKAAGQGFGFSFPGRTRNPIALFGPWMRIDYIFASHEWRFLSSYVERDRPSQHRAVVALMTAPWFTPERSKNTGQ